VSNFEELSALVNGDKNIKTKVKINELINTFSRIILNLLLVKFSYNF